MIELMKNSKRVDIIDGYNAKYFVNHMLRMYEGTGKVDSLLFLKEPQYQQMLDAHKIREVNKRTKMQPEIRDMLKKLYCQYLKELPNKYEAMSKLKLVADDMHRAGILKYKGPLTMEALFQNLDDFYHQFANIIRWLDEHTEHLFDDDPIRKKAVRDTIFTIKDDYIKVMCGVKEAPTRVLTYEESELGSSGYCASIERKINGERIMLHYINSGYNTRNRITRIHLPADVHQDILNKWGDVWSGNYWIMQETHKDYELLKKKLENLYNTHSWEF